MSEGQPNICSKPGCGMEMEEEITVEHADGTPLEWAYICPATPREHELSAKLAAAEAKVRELEEGDEALLAVLPEDFGAVEYIKHLTSANAALKAEIADMDRWHLRHGHHPKCAEPTHPFITAICDCGYVQAAIRARKKGAEHGE